MYLKIQTEVECPSVPNFIKTIKGETVDVAEFTNDQLRTIGDYWTKQLLKNAEKRRSNQPTTNQPQDE